jgi:uncharacterized protein (TIGR03437 family)
MIQGRLIAAVSWCLFIAGVPAAFAQADTAPRITGVVSSASYASPVEPGSLVSIFGSNLATGRASAPGTSLPLPKMLDGTSVTFNGVAAPLFFVSSGQINAQMPSSIAASPVILSWATVVVSSPSGSSDPAQVSTFTSGPAVFTPDSSGCGQALALNNAPDGTVSLNSPSNSAAPGDYVSIFGTGLGTPQVLPADGYAATAADPFIAADGLSLDNVGFGPPQYSGLAPTLVGVDQINFQVPENTRQGCAVPLTVATDSLPSQVVTISVNSSRGQCVDPPLQSHGQVSLEKTVASGTANDGETDEFKATFPSAPGLMKPPVPVFTPGSTTYILSRIASSSRVCSIAGDTELSAGAINIQAQGGNVIAALPVSQADGVVYRQTLPAGYVRPAQYTISSAAGAPVGFQETFPVGSNINVQTNLAPGTQLSASKSPVITWTGGDASSIVRVTLIGDTDQVGGVKAVWYTAANAGSMILSATCTGGPGTPPFCTFGVPSTPKAELIIDVLPANGVADSIVAQGISQQVRFSWVYRHVFGGLSTTN